MANDYELHLSLRRQKLTQDTNGRNVWEVIEEPRIIPASATAILICDMWDNHWSRGAAQRVDAMAPRMNNVVSAARARGVTIIHAPSNCMEFYAGTPARQQLIDAPRAAPPESSEHPDPPLPFEAPERGSDTGETADDYFMIDTRQHPAIEVMDEDGVSEDGEEVYSYFHPQGIENMLIMGVHTNMCILHRTYGIKQMVMWGLNVILVRDLTDALYNPAKPPYVSHEEGTQLVIGYIEKFWCPSISSNELMATL